MKIITIVDDYGEKTYGVSSEKDGMFYLNERNADGWRQRFNSREGTVEHFNPAKNFWDVEIAYIYQVDMGAGYGKMPFYNWRADQ